MRSALDLVLAFCVAFWYEHSSGTEVGGLQESASGLGDGSIIAEGRHQGLL